MKATKEKYRRENLKYRAREKKAKENLYNDESPLTRVNIQRQHGQQQQQHNNQIGQFGFLQIPHTQPLVRTTPQQQQQTQYSQHHQPFTVYRDGAPSLQQRQHNLQLNMTGTPLREVTNSGQYQQQQQNAQTSPVVYNKRRRYG
ncbi:unnamed protein product [Ambrosiozyma monospora]|uniref:Unnamed protein product n=1 Tax=Ambrosiozyma monospora TaxID=43982 RepID=A0ACB5SZM8_AMBMO|nr:unnamed protein product [Ambrosiozyma monospora]